MKLFASGDFGTYRRLLGYLHGTKRIIIAVIMCMVLEAIFTVATISMVKPVLDLLFRGRLVDTSRVTAGTGLELGRLEVTAGNAAVRKGVGDALGRRASEDLHEAVAALVAPPCKLAVLDLSLCGQIDHGCWAQVYYAKILSAKNGINTVVIVPVGAAAPPEIATAGNFTLASASSGAAARLRRELLDNLAAPAPAKQPRTWTGAFRNMLLDKFRPWIESVEKYSARDRMCLFRVLSVVIGIMLINACLLTLASFASGYLSGMLGNLVVQRLRDHAFQHIMSLDIQFFSSRPVGSLISIVLQDIITVEGAIEVLFSNVLKTPITVVILVSAMFFLSPSLTLFCIVTVPMIVALIYVLGRKVRKVSASIQKTRADVTARVQEAFMGVKVVKSFNMEPYECRQFSRDNWRIFQLVMKTRAAEETGSGLTGLLGFATLGAMILIGGYYVLNLRVMTPSDFILFVGLISQVFRPLKGVSRVNSRIQKGLAGCDRVFRVLDTQSEMIDKPGAIRLGPLQNEIVYDDVTFAYARHREPVLRNITMRVQCGKAVAIVGETGSGKSTLVNLLPRFYDPNQGRITYDGIDLRGAQLRSLRAQIAVITQDVVLFNDTVANNIRYGSSENVTRDQIVGAARDANADRFITALPRGYDTIVGGRGTGLSGGEKQRLAIARAILKNAPVLVLDEATSSLDSETEALIQEALRRVIKGRTVFVIAHRLSTIQNCDEIYVMENGRFVERGTHGELLKLGGRYARFHQIQFGKTQPAK
ncbi:MAG: ABC transporter ATP-binding protein [Candidatus Sumerlaeota bacterium]|nr:ABC transporter ATP-binding protein [Candidatus Sumerlaeota bacterium]